MAQLLVRDIDLKTVERLKKRARDNGRSLQSEVRQILNQAANATLTMSEFRALADRIRKQLSNRKHRDSTLLVARDRAR